MSIRNVFMQTDRSRLRAGWRIVIGFVAMMLVITPLVVAVDAIDIPFIESFLWQFLAAIALIGLARVFARYLDHREFGEYGLAWSPTQVIGGFAVAGVIAGVIYGVQLALGWVQVTDTIYTRYRIPFIVGWFGFFVRYASVALYEELFHRGFLITNLAEGLNGTQPRRGWAVVLTAVSFGLLHMTNDNATMIGALNIALFGVLLGVPYIRTGSLAFPIGLHFGWNFLVGPVLGLPVSGYEPRVSILVSENTGPELWTGGAFGPEGGLLATLVLGIGLVIMLCVGSRRAEPNRID